jgi:hypothetical protein
MWIFSWGVTINSAFFNPSQIARTSTSTSRTAFATHAAVLTSFKSSQLIVYKNKLAFEEKQEPIDPTESLGWEEYAWVDGNCI